jgi:hypothetical protein
MVATIVACALGAFTLARLTLRTRREPEPAVALEPGPAE